MSVAVYANGMSIACKVADGKTIAAFPDVCLSPPAPPIPPIPYPNTAAASDTTDGSKTVQIGGEEVMLKDKSTFKTSTGNEAATKSFGMGVVTHQITGKAAFVAWSMDVKFEGENIPRHMDLTGHNEGSDPPNTPPWPYMDSMSPATTKPRDPECKKLEDEMDEVVNRDKRNPTDGRTPGEGTHGLRIRFGEQIYGALAPGTKGWETHEGEIQGGIDKLKRLLKRHAAKGCGPPPDQATTWSERTPPSEHDYRGPGYSIFGGPTP